MGSEAAVAGVFSPGILQGQALWSFVRWYRDKKELPVECQLYSYSKTKSNYGFSSLTKLCLIHLSPVEYNLTYRSDNLLNSYFRLLQKTCCQ